MHAAVKVVLLGLPSLHARHVWASSIRVLGVQPQDCMVPGLDPACWMLCLWLQGTWTSAGWSILCSDLRPDGLPGAPRAGSLLILVSMLGILIFVLLTGWGLQSMSTWPYCWETRNPLCHLALVGNEDADCLAPLSALASLPSAGTVRQWRTISSATTRAPTASPERQARLRFLKVHLALEHREPHAAAGQARTQALWLLDKTA